jgi:hypothetical protein
MRRPPPADPRVAAEQAFRVERAGVLATLIRYLGDFELVVIVRDPVPSAARARAMRERRHAARTG